MCNLNSSLGRVSNRRCERQECALRLPEPKFSFEEPVGVIVCLLHGVGRERNANCGLPRTATTLAERSIFDAQLPPPRIEAPDSTLATLRLSMLTVLKLIMGPPWTRQNVRFEFSDLCISVSSTVQ